MQTFIAYFLKDHFIKRAFIFFILTILFSVNSVEAQDVAILKYDGGGDWYANPTAVPNLIRFSNQHNNTRISEKPKTVSAESKDLFSFPIIFMTGHGNVFFDEISAENLASYLKSGGFLHISDNYGIDPYVRREMKKVFPDIEFTEVPAGHPVYHQKYNFKRLPKIHEHDNKPAQGFGLFYQGRLVCFYDYQCDLSDGWEDKAVHHDPDEIRLKALQMGSNIISYAFKY